MVKNFLHKFDDARRVKPKFVEIVADLRFFLMTYRCETWF